MVRGGTTELGAHAFVRIHLQLVGTPWLRTPTREPHVLERKDAALLALLAVSGATPRARAAALVWSDVDDERARNNLRQRLFRLRRAAGADVVVADNVLQLADRVAHDLAGLPERLDADAAAGAGDLLGNLDYSDCAELAEWVDIAREQWRTTRRHALAEIAARLEGERQIARALIYAERLVADDPLLEHAHRRVMRLHYLRGDRAAALASFDRAREILRCELDAAPGHETTDLASLIEGSGKLGMPSPAARPVAMLRPPRLVGRDAEWQTLQRAFAQHRTVLVGGEPGIGKTRLLTDFSAQHDSAHVFGARPGDARVPYALLARVVRGLTQNIGKPESAGWVVPELARIAPELGAAAKGKLDPLRLRQAVTSALAYWHHAGLQLLALDDLHFADEATLELLPAIATSPEAHLTWLLGARVGEMPAAVKTWLAAQDGDAVLQISLGPLTEPAIQALLESLSTPEFDAHGWAAPLARHTGGNPMFILETLLAMVARGPDAFAHAGAKLPAPANIGQLIERRLTQLSPAALKLARVAAIAGQDFSAELAASVLGHHALDIADAWRELEGAQVIRDNAFAHDLIYEATLKSVPEPIARVTHRDIAAYLEARGGAAARIASHWEEAREQTRAARLFEHAASAAHTASRRTEELALLERAQHCYAQVEEHAARFDCLHRAIGSALHVGSIRLAEELIERMRPLVDSDRQRAALLIDEARISNTLVREQAALAAATEASRIAEHLGDTALRLEAGRELAGALSKLDRHTDALLTLQRLRPLLEEVPAGEQVFSFLADFAYLLCYADRPREAIEEYDRVHRMALDAGDLATAHTALTDQAVALIALGQLRHSTQAYERARALRERLGDSPGWSLMDDMALAGNYRELGRYREALEMTLTTLEGLRAAGFDTWVYQTEHDLAIMYAQLGQPGRARTLLCALPSDAVPLMRITRLATLAKIERWAGRPSRRQWDEARILLDRINTGRAYVRLTVQLGQLRESDDKDVASQIARLRVQARGCEQTAIERCALAYETEALVSAGKLDAALAGARELVTLLHDWAPIAIYAPEVWLIAHSAFKAAGADTEAAHALQQAAVWIMDNALPNVPDEFAESFLNRNPVNNAILTMAARTQ